MKVKAGTTASHQSGQERPHEERIWWAVCACGNSVSSVPFDFFGDFNASAKHGPSSPLGRSGQKLNPSRRVHAVVHADRSCWIRSNQGQLHHGQMETPTVSVLALNHYTKIGNVSAAVQCVPVCTSVYEREMLYHYCVCLKCWGDVEVLQNDQFFQVVSSGSWNPFCACSCPALVITAKTRCLAASSEGLRINKDRMEGTYCFLCLKALETLKNIRLH